MQRLDVPGAQVLAACERTGAFLREVGFGDRAVARALGYLAWTGPDLDGTWWRRRNLDESPVGELVDVLVRGEARDTATLHRRLPQAAWEGGLVEDRPGGSRAAGTLLPLGEDLLWTDRADRAFRGDDGLFLPDSTSFALRRALPPGRVGRHLDLGCGGGAVTAAASARADHTVAVDLNPRVGAAVPRTLALSGQPQADVLVGDALADGAVDVLGGPFDRVSFVLPLLVPWRGLTGGPVHTVARSSDLLLRVLAALPRLLAPDGLALLYCQDWVGGGPLAPAVHAAFGERPVSAAFWWDCEAERTAMERSGHADGRPLRAGVLALRADRAGEVVIAANDAPDMGVDDWWPWLRVLLDE